MCASHHGDDRYDKWIVMQLLQKQLKMRKYIGVCLHQSYVGITKEKNNRFIQVETGAQTDTYFSVCCNASPLNKHSLLFSVFSSFLFSLLHKISGSGSPHDHLRKAMTVYNTCKGPLYEYASNWQLGYNFPKKACLFLFHCRDCSTECSAWIYLQLLLFEL